MKEASLDKEGFVVIRDRGAIKWTAMMLPEHVRLLRDWVKEDGYEEKPLLDEQKLEELHQLIDRSFHEKSDVMFTYYEHHTFQAVKGRVLDIDFVQRKIHIEAAGGEKKVIKLEDLIDIQE